MSAMSCRSLGRANACFHLFTSSSDATGMPCAISAVRNSPPASAGTCQNPSYDTPQTRPSRAYLHLAYRAAASQTLAKSQIARAIQTSLYLPILVSQQSQAGNYQTPRIHFVASQAHEPFELFLSLSYCGNHTTAKASRAWSSTTGARSVCAAASNSSILNQR